MVKMNIMPQPCLEFIDGNEAIMRGALDAGCDFFAGYPITPATSLLLIAIRELPKVGGIAVQAEDEIGGISMCIAASMAGRKVLTATSGPGLSLYSESIGLAIMGEVPLVIVDSQRMGPATGGATTHGEGDIQFARWGTSGGYPLIVLAPRDLRTSYELTVHAFNLAERYRTPVLLMTSKELSLTRRSEDTATWQAPALLERRYYSGEPAEFLPYRFEPGHDAPDFLPIGAAVQVRFTTSIHGPDGQLTNDAAKRREKLEHLSDKVTWDKPGVSLYDYDPQAGAAVLIVSYGFAAQAALDAVDELRQQGVRVSSLVLYTLWPVPEGVLLEALAAHSQVVAPEHNNGQYLLELERLADRCFISLQRFDGTLISPTEITQAVLDAVAVAVVR